MTPHTHCPMGCEHPQPLLVSPMEWFDIRDCEAVCGRCWHVDGVLTPMVPCTEEVCE